MAQMIRPPGYGQPNLKPTITERHKAKSTRKSAAEKREGNSEKHLELLRLLPCCITGKTPAGEVHHLKAGAARLERGMGQRATDQWGLPLSRIPHDAVERIGSRQEHAFFRENGVDDPYELAAALWQATGDLDRMRRVLQAHVGRGRRGR